ncbi:gamma-mobile-trio recombinase GmtY [Microbacteriaceae bacterium K1510]|nr:gamma-mobile-trio recombinase GmtY [Microbacteriaceae bacterium K1510]
MPPDQTLWFVNEPQPLHHVTVVKRVQDMPESFTARVLVLRRPDGSAEPYPQLLRYQRAHPHRSSSWQNTVVRAVGLLWDYTTQVKHHTTVRDLFRGFALAILSGTIKEDGSDPTGLLWPSTPRSRAVGLVKSIEAFAEWCSSEDDAVSPITTEILPLVPGTADHMTQMLVWHRMRRASMLQHIKAAPKSYRRPIVDHGRDPRGHDAEPVKFFPPEYAEKLLWEGHKRPATEREPNIFLRYNVRDMMIALLDGWGGLRRSEGLHLWLDDVIDDPTHPGQALVVLHHPAESKLHWHNPLTGRSETLTRREVLYRAYGLRPRNDVKRGAYHAGWKGMDLDGAYRARVFWIDDKAAALFWMLYLGYIRYVRPVIMEQRTRLGGRDHPFLFVSERINAKTGLPGEPYSEKAYERNHQAAVERMGLVHAKERGTTTHGLRHLYGQTLAKLSVPAQVIKKGLHHRSFLSQAPYVAPDAQTTNATLRSAQGRIARGEFAQVKLGNNTSTELLKLRNYLSGGGGA